MVAASEDTKVSYHVNAGGGGRRYTAKQAWSRHQNGLSEHVNEDHR